jgi:hypothetical protein
MKTIAENTVTWGGADLSMAFRIEGLTSRERAQLASHLLLVVQDAVDTLNDDGALHFTPASSVTARSAMLAELGGMPPFDTAALDERIREVLGAATVAPVIDAPPTPAKRKRRTRAEIAADNAAAEAAAAATALVEEAAETPVETPVVEAPVVEAPVVEAPVTEAEEVAAAVEAAAVVSTKPAHPQSKAKAVETSTLKVDDETFTVVWSQTGGHISGKIVIPKALADRLGGEPTTLTETSDSKTSVKEFLAEAVGDYRAAIVFKQQQQQAAPAKVEEPAPKVKAKAAPKAALKAAVVVADDESPAIPPSCLQQVISNPDPDGAARSKFVSDWVEHLFKNRVQLGIKSAEEAGAWCMKHQAVVTWFVKKPLGGATPRAVAAAWSVYAAEEAAKLNKASGGSAFDDEDGDDEAFGQVA